MMDIRITWQRLKMAMIKMLKQVTRIGNSFETNRKKKGLSKKNKIKDIRLNQMKKLDP